MANLHNHPALREGKALTAVVRDYFKYRYRKLWSHLNTSGVLVRREDVTLALLELDPQNVDKRRRRRL